MGIDFSHSEAAWSYGGFNRFRNKLVATLGVGTTFDNICESKNIQPIEKFEILPLLNHSDCDGELTPKEMKQIIPQLKDIVSNWDDNDYDKQNALELIEGMENAISNNENLEFR